MTSIPLAPGGKVRYIPADDATEMPSRALELRGFLRLVDCVTAAGITPPREFVAVREQFNAFQTESVSGRRPMRDRLTDAIISGAGDTAALFAAALAERNTPGALELLEEVHAVILRNFRTIYTPHAAAAYRQLADRFDKAAENFTRGAAIVNPDAPADSVVSAKPKIVEAWRHAEIHAAELDTMVEPLSAAAELVRDISQPSGLGIDRNPFTLPLCADVDDIHRRIAWHAWHDLPEPRPVDGTIKIEDLERKPDEPPNTRCGRWTRLHRAGAIIRAHPNPAELVLFGQPKPTGWKPTQQAGNSLYPRKPVLTRFDPEGDLGATPKRRPLDRLRDALTRRNPDEQPEPDVLATVADAEHQTNG